MCTVEATEIILTGDDNEWVKLSDTCILTYQNKKCPYIYKDNTGQAYNVSSILYSKDNGKTWYSNNDSITKIQFPYTIPDIKEYKILDEHDNIIKVLDSNNISLLHN